MVKVQNQLTKLYGSLEHFTTHQWRFTDDNVRYLLTCMSKKDREIFQFDVTEINWDTYLKNSVIGIRKFLLKQSDESLPISRIKMTWSQFFLQYFFFLSNFVELSICVKKDKLVWDIGSVWNYRRRIMIMTDLSLAISPLCHISSFLSAPSRPQSGYLVSLTKNIAAGGKNEDIWQGGDMSKASRVLCHQMFVY